MPIKYREGFKYQLAEDYAVIVPIFRFDVGTDYIELDPTGRLLIRKGYAWDGPSGPTVDTPSFMRGALIHDSLYQLIRLELLPPGFKEVADRILKRICIEDGMNRLRAWYVYHAVSKFAGFAASPKNKKKILTAP